MAKLPDFFGSYRLARFIRSGSACQIWESIKDDGSGRYALKILRREHWGRREEIGYLKHEFDVAHGLKHPNIIRILEFNTEGTIAYLVLELFSVLNLKQALRQGYERLMVQFPRIVEQCASALAYLHEQGWVHCDVKPDNFLLSDEGETKLIDFTIAQRASKGALSRFFRRRGTIRGTRSYMSPEQIRQEALDARSDIYSFGCVMYELLTAKVPYTGDSPNDLLNKHLKAAIPSTLVHNNNVTEDLSQLVRRMMAKRREDRPGSMYEVLKEFRSLRPFKTPPKLPEAMAQSDADAGE